jgi:hypothetical protein
MREPFPLQWPDGWARTADDERRKSKFGYRQSGNVPFGQARAELLAELDRLGAANAVITSDLPTRADGLPYAATNRVGDTGIAVWFVLADDRGNMQERVFACDKWRSHAENMSAIAHSIAALRGLDRWGASDVVTRAFAGFNALPPGSSDDAPPAPKKREWRDVLEMGNHHMLPVADQLLVAKARHREAIKRAHPDAGGTHEAAAELNAALAEAEAELSR